MKFIKNLFFNLLGQRKYLLVVSRGFFILYNLGILRFWRKFDTHYLAPEMVSEGDTVLDIGANVGYFSRLFCTRAGNSGRVICVEPVEVYRDVLRSNTGRCSRIEILPFALGDTNGTVKMDIPSADRTRHGLTRITGNGPAGEKGWEVEVRDSKETFGELSGLNYIKCDIEGYENRVIPGLYGLIERERPVIQIELAEENFNEINNRLQSFGYRPYQAIKKRLVEIEIKSIIKNDVIYLTEELSLSFNNIIDLPRIKNQK